MLTEAVLKGFSLDALYELMILKLEEFEQMGDTPTDRELHFLKRIELDLIQKVIDEKKIEQENKRI